ncbi:hypothetical protein CRUP_027328 [Coryphaenoides rupestris]|nr:hypothetical protein CRUP_027328 [Coryphaenoides rupestris]
MAATEANAAPVVQEDGKAAETTATEPETTATEPETKATEAESAAPANSETVSGKEAAKDGEVTEVADGNAAENKESAANDTAAGEGGEEAPTSSTTEPKTSFLDSFLNRSGLGKVMRKKKEEASEAVGDKEPEKGAEEAQGAEGEGAAPASTPENGEKEENEEKKEEKKEEKARSSVRDLIRNPVARIFHHRDKKEGGTGEEAQPKALAVRSKSLDRLEDPEALNTSSTAAAADTPVPEGGAEEEQKASSSSSSSTKHMKRWHSFKKLMAQKTHKKGAAVGEELKEEEAEGGGGDSSTLDSKDSGQRRWKLKRSWTFQGLKRDPSMVGISGKTKDPEEAPGGEEVKPEEEGGEEKAEGGEEAKAEEGGEEKAEGAEEEKAGASGGGGVSQHANEIWTSFKKRVIPKSKRTNTENAPAGEEDTPAAGEEAGGGEDQKDGKAVKAKRSTFGRAVSLKNFIMRKGRSSSLDLGEGGAKEEEEEEQGEEGGAAEEGEAPGDTTATAETNDKPAAVADVKAESGVEPVKEAELVKEAEPVPAKEAEPSKEAEQPTKEAESAKEAGQPAKASETPVTNGENGCANGDDHAPHNHHDDEQPEAGPVKKGKEEAKAPRITAANDQKAGNV